MLPRGVAAGWLLFAKQQAPAAGFAQHVPVVLLKGPVLLAGHSHAAPIWSTTIMSWPPTVACARPVKRARPFGAKVAYEPTGAAAPPQTMGLSGVRVRACGLRKTLG